MAGEVPLLTQVPTTTYYPVHTYKNYPVNVLGEPLVITGYTDSGLPKLTTLGVVQARLIELSVRHQATEAPAKTGIKGVFMNLIGKFINRNGTRTNRISWDYPGVRPLPSWQN